MADKLRVGVIFGGRSGEHDVSLMSARSVLGALDADKYQMTEIGISREGDWLVGEQVLEAMRNSKVTQLPTGTILPDPRTGGSLLRRQPYNQGELIEAITPLDVVIPILHGTFGEDGTLQGLLELADVAYVGAGVVGSAVGMDKGIFKDVMRANGIPVVDSMLVLRLDIEARLEAVLERSERIAPYPLFTKPANLGSSVGVSKCMNRSDLVEGLIEAAQYDRRVMVERGVNAREIEVSVLGNDSPEASIPGEIVPAADFYSYDAKYHDSRSTLLIPAPIPESVAEQAQAMAVQAFRAIDCAGMARVDFLYDKDHAVLYLNELNTIPGFTSISMYPKLWQASGMSYPALLDRLIELALERKADRDRNLYQRRKEM